MFKHETVVEEVRAAVSAPSFNVVDIANPAAALPGADGGALACTWNSGCVGCSGCSASCSGGCSGGGSCVGCSSTFNNASQESTKLSAQDLILAVKV